MDSIQKLNILLHGSFAQPCYSLMHKFSVFVAVAQPVPSAAQSRDLLQSET